MGSKVVDVMESKIVDKFEYKGYECLIRKMDSDIVLNHAPNPFPYHCGYVRIDTHEFNHELNDIVTSETVEITFGGKIDKDDIEGTWIGFDSAHHWNVINPHTKTFGSVKQRTKDLVDEIKEKYEKESE